MIIEFEGVNCREIEQVEKYLKLLKLTLNLEPKEKRKKLQKTWDKAISFLTERWIQLKKEHSIDESTYQEWMKKLNAVIKKEEIV